MSTATYICIRVPVWCMNGWRGLAVSQKCEGRRTKEVDRPTRKLDSVSDGGGDGALSNESSVPPPPPASPLPYPYPCAVVAVAGVSSAHQTGGAESSPIKGRVRPRPALSWLRNAPQDTSAPIASLECNRAPSKTIFQKEPFTNSYKEIGIWPIIQEVSPCYPGLSCLQVMFK